MKNDTLTIILEISCIRMHQDSGGSHFTFDMLEFVSINFHYNQNQLILNHRD